MLRPILFDISAHGLGHLAQAAPVVMAVARLLPETPLIVRSGLPLEVLRRRIACPFELMPSEDDFGLEMSTSFAVDYAATVARYQALHAHWSEVVAELADRIRARDVSVVVANVGYVSLAAAQQAGVANIAFSSINWHDVVRHYCGKADAIAPVLADIGTVYRRADLFLRLVPGTGMAGFSTEPVAELIVARGRTRADELRTRLPGDRLLIAFSFTDSERQGPPVFEPGDAMGIACIGPKTWAGSAPWIAFDDIGLPFIDLVASVDLIVAKPGYGIVTEAAVAGTPTLLVPRDDWPETATTSEWYRRHGRFEVCRQPLDRLRAEDLIATHSRLAALPARPPAETDGAERIARVIADRSRA